MTPIVVDKVIHFYANTQFALFNQVISLMEVFITISIVG